jgi:hypothetical protein
MEVHAHSHTERKKWTHYLWEFIMLFLAVFCGFMAENLREHEINKGIERNNMKSLVRNLQEDSNLLVRSIKVNEERFNYLDSLIYLKNKNIPDDVFQKEFIFYMLKLGYIDYFVSNQSTFKQMQSSGTLRLISNPGVLDSILSYENSYERIKKQEDRCSSWWNKSIEQVSSIIDLTPLAHMSPTALKEITIGDLENIDASDVSKNLPALRSYYNWRVNERIALGYYIQFLHEQLSNILALIPFLQKHYHLK